jgi:hypothetical protein
MPAEVTTLTASGRPRYFVVFSKADGSIREWDLSHWDKTWPVDCRFYAKVFQRMEQYLTVPDLRVYLTWDINAVPEYGPNVVVILFGDEFGQMPRYARFVNTILKAPRSTKPLLGIRRWFPFDGLRRNMLLKYVRNMVLHWKSVRRESQASYPVAPVLKEPHILHVPCGTCMLDELPVKPMRERPYHCFFAGQIDMTPARGMAALTESPKQIARRAMIKAMLALKESNPRFRLDHKVLQQTGSDTSDGDNRTYSERMMDSKICLTPRGTVIDTWRFFEGMKSGCLVVCEPLPDDYFYRGAPVLEIDSWDELEKTVTPLLDDDEALQQWSDRSLEFWKNVCGEDALGRRIAEFIAASPASRQLLTAATAEA